MDEIQALLAQKMGGQPQGEQPPVMPQEQPPVMPPDQASQLQVMTPEMDLLQHREQVKEQLKQYRLKEVDQEMQEILKARMKDIESEQEEFAKSV